MNNRSSDLQTLSNVYDIFYSQLDKPFGCFQNFFVSPFVFGSRTWQTVEHCYQAAKFEDNNVQERIRNQPNAYMAALIGRDKSLPLRAGWDEGLKLRYMSAIVFQKYTQCEIPRLTLLETDGRNLYELSYKNNFWGTKPDKSGLNHHGKITMAVREHLLKEEANRALS